jgi:hypothetical protein
MSLAQFCLLALAFAYQSFTWSQRPESPVFRAPGSISPSARAQNLRGRSDLNAGRDAFLQRLVQRPKHWSICVLKYGPSRRVECSVTTHDLR